MSTEARHRRILEAVRRRGSMRVAELGVELGVAAIVAGLPFAHCVSRQELERSE